MSSSRLLLIEAGTIVTPLQTFSPGRLLIKGAVISEVGSSDAVRRPRNAPILDASKLIVVPGFIDPHVHGFGGVDVMEGTYESLDTISTLLARHGTTAFVPTSVSSEPDQLRLMVENVGSLIRRSFSGAIPIGIHLEGPFINVKRRGAHKASGILEPDPQLFREWLSVSNRALRLITVAPELKGIEAIISLAMDAGVTVAMGHSDASYDEADVAAARGVCYAVHTFNAMREFAPRDPGIIGKILADDRIFAEIIADGIHVSPATVRIFARAKGRDRILLATDVISAAGMPNGPYRLGRDRVSVSEGVCRNMDGRLAGSTLTQDRALRNFILWTGNSFEDALRGLTLNPARALKLERKGILEPGADADIAILDQNFEIAHTYVGGRLVWTN